MEKYTLNQILEMVGGYEFFTENQIMYMLHKCNEKHEIAKKYLDTINEENLIRLEKTKNMITDKTITTIDENNLDLETKDEK